MPLALLFEGKVERQWKTLGVQRPGDPPATISHMRAHQREVYVAQCFADHATICRLPGGIDIEQGRHRIIDAKELATAILVRRLVLAQTMKMIITNERAKNMPVRYRCVMMADDTRSQTVIGHPFVKGAANYCAQCGWPRENHLIV